MSSNNRATRSSARQAARSSRAAGEPAGPRAGPPTDPPAAPTAAASRRPKRTVAEVDSPEQNTSGRRSKRARAPEHPPPAPPAPQPQSAYSLRKRQGKQATTMSSPEYGDPNHSHTEQPRLILSRSAAGPSIPPSDNAPSASSSRKSSRNKKHASGELPYRETLCQCGRVEYNSNKSSYSLLLLLVSATSP